MPDFPTTAELTSFDGPNENPLSDSGRWANYGGRPPLRRVTGGAFPTVEFPPNGSYWTVDAFRSPCEAWGCREGGGLGAANESWRIGMWLNDPNLLTGYLALYGGGIGETYVIRRYTNGSFTDLVEVGGSPPSRLGIRITPTTVEQWAQVAGVWALVQFVNDTTYRGVFYVGLELEEQGGINEVWWSCFGGGILNRQHIYRILRVNPGIPA